MKQYLYLLLFLQVAALHAQSPATDVLSWRMIGPHRGGRTVGVCGADQQPNVFYMGVNNGGVWKTTDYGRTWNPIFDDQPTGSIGDVAVAPSNPNVVYVASGEGIQRPDLSVGDGIYKSTDGGKTWTHLEGLRDGQQIGGLSVDPRDENRVFAAVMGHPYGPNPERGVYRTTDGGKSWQKVLYSDENTGAAQVQIDPNNSNTVYADMFESRLAPWENGEWQGPGSGLYKSIDGGTTWTHLTGGLPGVKEGLGRIGFCTAPSYSNRVYATVDARERGGIYRSNDAGQTWELVNEDPRLHGRGDDFAEIKADPKNADIVYTACEVTWKSTDGGKSWSAFRGAPGGDDSHRLWINRLHPEIIALAGDQGTLITVNGGQTWSSWYNQPTAQFYHVSTDNAFPYNVYGAQQESGSAGVSSRGNDGAVTFRDWHPVGAEEWGYVAPDPLDPNIIYGGKISRFDKRTGQNQNIAPEAIHSGQYRFVRTAPLMFSPVDPHTLYYAGNVLFKTTNGGNSWSVISPDLTRETYDDIPTGVGKYITDEVKKMPRRGVIYALAPSPKDINTIWAGTDDGLLHITRDGGAHWANITPPQVTVWSKISQIDASHTDVGTAYVAVNRIRCDDMKPHILRTRDGGAHWQEIVTGLPAEPVNTVREDPERKGLLFAGTEHAVYVSFDDGEHWQSLRRNMPATSIRDLVIKDDDIVVGTHGRSFWIMDNITPLRQEAAIAAAKEPVLFKPQLARRVRWDNYTDTPMPQEEPVGQNPPDGAMIDFYLKDKPAGVVTLDIKDQQGNVLRHYASNAVKRDIPNVNIPEYWIRPQQFLSDKPGLQRFLWDLHLDPLPEVQLAYPISAVYGQTAPEPSAPWVMPGTYTVALTVDGKTYTQPILVEMDPRTKTPRAKLQEQYDWSKTCYEIRHQSHLALEDVRSLRAQIKSLLPLATGSVQSALKDLDTRAAALENAPHGSKQAGFANLGQQAAGVFRILQESDMEPTSQALAGAKTVQQTMADLLPKWTDIKTKEIPALNADLHKAGLHRIGFLDDPTWQQHPVVSGKAWKTLFTGDLSDGMFPKGIWSIQNKELTATEDQCIWTKKKYRDFVLDLEFKTASGTNSGVIVHCSNPENWIPNSVEIQIADDFHEEWANAPATWQCGAVFGHLAARQHEVKPAGEWNHYTVTCIDRKIWVVLNGVLVNTMDMSKWTSGKQNPDGTSIPSWLNNPFATLPLEGHIGLQGKHAGAPIWFRNIRIREL
jgi:photosystem II stability/assembly factor-like uncharacterized protein